MDVAEAIKARRSVRSYVSKAVPTELLERLLEAARLAPSALNFQPWRFVVVTNPAKRRAIVDASFGQAWIAQAPAIIVCCADTMPGQRIRRYDRMTASGRFSSDITGKFVQQCREKGLTRQAAVMKDTVIAMEHMALQAVDLGLASCFVGIFDEELIKKALKIPQDLIIVNLLVVGYATEVPPPRTRRALEEIAFWDEYGRSWPRAHGQ